MKKDGAPPTRIRYIYTESQDYRVVHATGAYGGVIPQGDEFRLDLFQEYNPPPTDQVHKVIDGIKVVAEPEEPAEPEGESKIMRERIVGVTLSLDTAERIGQWLVNKVQDFREKQQKMLEHFQEDEEDGDT